MGRVVEDLTTLARADDGGLLEAGVAAPGQLHGLRHREGGDDPGGPGATAASAAPGAVLRADPQRLAQALMNLLQNAASMPAGQDPVRFGVRARALQLAF